MDAILPQFFSDLRDPVPFSGKPPCLPRACLCAGAPRSPQGSAHSGAQASAMLLCCPPRQEPKTRRAQGHSAKALNKHQ